MSHLFRILATNKLLRALGVSLILLALIIFMPSATLYGQSVSGFSLALWVFFGIFGLAIAFKLMEPPHEHP